METKELLAYFMRSIPDNPRITAYHVSVYAALLFYWHQKGAMDSFLLFSRDLLPHAKLSRPGTYHRIMNDLAELGYISYIPSHSPVLGSLISVVKHRQL